MKSTAFFAAAAVMIAAFCFFVAGPDPALSQDPAPKVAPGPPPQPIPDQYIVVLKETAARPVAKQPKPSQDRMMKAKLNEPARSRNLAKLKEVHGKAGIQNSAVKDFYADAIVGFSGKLSKTEVDSLRRNPEVEGVYQDMAVALGPITVQGKPSKTPPGADFVTCTISTAGGPVDGSAKASFIWILDTGADMNHPDLNIQAAFAKSFVSQPVEDRNGHGTHCAGIAAAKANGTGVVGVSSGAKVVPVKVLDKSGSGSWSGIIAGLDYVSANDGPGDVVSMSLGAYPVAGCQTAQPTLAAAIQNLGLSGTAVVIAAGNDGQCNGAASSYPGCLNGTNIYTIGSINCDGTPASYSNWGAGIVDFAAVGTAVYSTYRGGGYATLSGTSMATPAVAGILHARNGAAPVYNSTVTSCGSIVRIARRN